MKRILSFFLALVLLFSTSGAFPTLADVNNVSQYGDVNADGFVNNKDLGVLMQYLNNWDITINEATADVNVDNSVNNKDYGLLMQYLNNWDVELGVVQNKLQTLNYQYFSNCIDGVMLVKNDANKIGMIDTSGKLLVDFNYNSGLVSDGGYVVFEKRYVYDKTGKLVFEDENATIEHCGNGVVLLTEYGEWKVEGHESWKSRRVYKKLDGTEIYSFFSIGDALCGQFNKQGYTWLVKDGCPCDLDSTVEIINLKGEVVNSIGANHMAVANSTWLLGEDGFVLTDDMVALGSSRYMNLQTKKEDIFDSDWQGENLYIWAENKGSNVNKFVFYPSNNDNGYPCCSVNSLSKISFDNSYYLFDIEQNKIIAEYSELAISESKYILVKNSNGKWGYIDKSGKEYNFYDDATTFDDGYAMVKIDGKLYVIDENFNVVSEAIDGDSASALYNKCFGVKKENDNFIVKFNPQ